MIAVPVAINNSKILSASAATTKGLNLSHLRVFHRLVFAWRKGLAHFAEAVLGLGNELLKKTAV